MAETMAQQEKSWVAYYFGDYARHSIALLPTILLITAACSLHGNVALVSLLIYKSLKSIDAPWLSRMIPFKKFLMTHNLHGLSHSNPNNVTLANDTIEGNDQLLPEYLQFCKCYGMKDWLVYLAYGMLSSFLMYHVVCGYLQWQYYHKQRDQPHKWKCQPKRFLTAANERHEIIVGTMNILYSGSISGTLSCWIANGNYTTVYFRPDEYGYLYLVLSIPIVFLYIEGAAYYYHRIVHTPFLYKHLHKHHHRYHCPTAYSAVAMSPIEITCFILFFAVPVFTIPVHAWVFAGNLMYINYYGMLDHSGIKLTSWFPWQPDSTFHDDHHRYFHCNFGFNLTLFDRIHDTLRRNDREYGEHIFYGKGKKNTK